MNAAQAIALFEQHQCHNIIVASKSGTEYCLNRDIVDDSIRHNEPDPFVYGTRTSLRASLRRHTVGEVRWFFLRNVKFVEPSAP